MSTKNKYPIDKRKKAGGRPLKKLLETRPKTENHSTQEKVLAHRSQFLEMLKRELSVPEFEEKSWSGTGLDLLLLTEKITPKMHRTALTYTYFFRKNIFSGPQLAAQPWGDDLMSFERMPYAQKEKAFSKTRADLDTDKAFEVLWQNLNQALKDSKIKSCIEKIGPENNLQATKNLMKSQEKIYKLRVGLEKVEIYLEDFIHLVIKEQKILQEQG